MPQDLFITAHYLLESDAARQLYNDYAKDMPIIDYHCHLPPQDVAENRSFRNMAEIWLEGDHYKWRAMRSNGIDEKYCTGDATDWEKFEQWAATVPYLLRNQLYPWTHLELKDPFGVSDKLLGPDTAKEIWEACNDKLKSPAFSARGLMEHFKVAMVGTTDDPTDDLAHHKAVAADDSFKVQMLPSWRPDKGMAIDKPQEFVAWVEKLEAVSGLSCADFDAYLQAIQKRHDYFHDCGCRAADHGIEYPYAEDYSQAEIKAIFSKAREGKICTEDEMLKFKSAMLYEFGLMNHAKGWVQQLHMSPIRNNNTRLFKSIGPDAGFDSIGDFVLAQPLSKYLDRLNQTDQLAKTILYTLNPKDNMVLTTMLGNFMGNGIPGKIQFGSGWWFNDTLMGMIDQMECLSQIGLLSRFVGMLTDSRSFLSYPRHDYFRRILCNLLGTDMSLGRIPKDMDLVGRMVRDISYNNAVRYFELDLPEIN